MLQRAVGALNQSHHWYAYAITCSGGVYLITHMCGMTVSRRYHQELNQHRCAAHGATLTCALTVYNHEVLHSSPYTLRKP